MRKNAQAPTPPYILALRHFNAERAAVWNRVRFDEFCNLVQSTPEALALQMGLRPSTLTEYRAKGKFPGPVCYILDMWEQSARSIMLGEKLLNPCPSPTPLIGAIVDGVRRIANGQMKDAGSWAREILSRLPAEAERAKS